MNEALYNSFCILVLVCIGYALGYAHGIAWKDKKEREKV